MTTDTSDTSSISFTAHYTGFVWYQHGLSHRAFATSQGRLFYRLLQPLEVVARRVVGSDVKTTLLQRHHLLDRELIKLIQQYPDIQVLELACGLSPRGWRINRRYPYIHYIEADLPAMARQKHALLKEVDSLNFRHEVAICNILVEDTPESLESLLQREFDPEKPVVVLTEGLINYFTLEQLNVFWSRLAQALQHFPAGFYLSDIYPQVQQHRFYNWIETANKVLKVSSRSHFSMHFQQPQQAVQFLQDCHFSKVTVFNPDAEKDLSLQKARGGALVWVMKAEVTPAKPTATV